MTEKSLFWFTDGFTGDVGDGGAPYTQEEFRLFNHAWMAHNQANVGVFPGALNELAVSGSSSPLSVATGRASVYGFPYWADSAVSLAVTTPSVGTTGGRVVLRADWTAQTVRAAVIMSADGTAAAPSMTQSAGSVWDIPLATFTITTGGAITLTDAREWIAPVVDGDTIEVNASGELETGDPVALFTRRQGGSATDYNTAGTTTYTPTSLVQYGCVNMGSVADGGAGSVNVTFPTAFSAKPIVLVSIEGEVQSAGANVDAWVASVSTTQAGLVLYNNSGDGAINYDLFWVAIGPA